MDHNQFEIFRERIIREAQNRSIVYRNRPEGISLEFTDGCDEMFYENTDPRFMDRPAGAIAWKRSRRFL